jgi:hypothetical protein
VLAGRAKLYVALVLAVVLLAWGPIRRASAAISADVLDRMDRSELGTLFNPKDAGKYRAADDLLQRFFDASASERKQIISQITATGLGPEIVGRLARLRENWLALAPGVYYINIQSGPFNVRYFLGIPPKYDFARSWPLVVKLPSANAFLTKPPPDAQAVTQIYSQWMTQELSDHPDAIVIMPLLNLDELYGPGPVGMNLVMQSIFDAANRADIDPARVYLAGHSMAANAVWNLAIHYPTYFAAINAMAGSAHDAWQRVRLGNLENILCIVWHDASDDVVNVDESRSIVRYLQNLKYDVDYTETRDLGHMPSQQIVEEEYTKMRTRTRDLYPSEVFIQSNSVDTIFNRADWVQIYQPMSPGEQAKVQFSRGSQGMYVYQNSFRVDAEIADRHTIRMDARNVRMVRLYLNDQMVDLDQPIQVFVDGTSRFNALVPRSMEEMLKDQLFLGPGWRYYTAVLDLDLTESPATKPTTRSHAPIEYIAPDGERKVFVPSGN